MGGIKWVSSCQVIDAEASRAHRDRLNLQMVDVPAWSQIHIMSPKGLPAEWLPFWTRRTEERRVAGEDRITAETKALYETLLAMAKAWECGVFDVLARLRARSN